MLKNTPNLLNFLHSVIEHVDGGGALLRGDQGTVHGEDGGRVKECIVWTPQTDTNENITFFNSRSRGGKEAMPPGPVKISKNKT